MGKSDRVCLSHAEDARVIDSILLLAGVLGPGHVSIFLPPSVGSGESNIEEDLFAAYDFWDVRWFGHTSLKVIWPLVIWKCFKRHLGAGGGRETKEKVLVHHSGTDMECDQLAASYR